MKKNMIIICCAISLFFTFFAIPAFASISGSTLTAVTKYTPGKANTLVYRCDTVTPDYEYMYTIIVNYLSGMNVTAGYRATGQANGGTFDYMGALGDAAIAHWDSTENLGAGYGSLVNGESGYFTNEVLVSAALSGDLILSYELIGDGYGSAPHNVTGTVTLEESIPPQIAIDALTFPKADSVISASQLTNIIWDAEKITDDIDGTNLTISKITLHYADTSIHITDIANNISNVAGKFEWDVPIGSWTGETNYVLKLEVVNSSSLTNSRIFSDNKFALVPEPFSVILIIALFVLIGKRNGI